MHCVGAGGNTDESEGNHDAAPAVCAGYPARRSGADNGRTDCGSLPVVGAATDGIVGIITDRDIVVRGIAEGRNPLTLTASECMTSPVHHHEDASVDDCTELMESKKVRRLPVVDRPARWSGSSPRPTSRGTHRARKPASWYATSQRPDASRDGQRPTDVSA